MVTRARLTSKTVDDSIVPDKGEKWIADTRVPGFGLRLIMTTAGPRKFYCIRATNQDGKSIRKSFDIEAARYNRRPIFLFEPSSEDIKAQEAGQPTLGGFVDEAREWASKEIAKLKGLKSLEDENADRVIHIRNKLSSATLEQAANSVLANYKKMGMTDAYLIRLSKLFSIHVPQNIRSTKLADFTEEQAIQLSNLKTLRSGNRQSLMPFLAKVFDTFHALTLTRNNFAITHQRKSQDVQYSNKDKSNSTTNQEKVETLFEILEAETKFWQQALCLRLYFEFRAPLSRLMAARWDEVFQRSYSSDFRPGIKMQDIIWKYSTKRFGHEIITERCFEFLLRLREKSESSFPDNPYWFPTSHGRSVEHIRSVEHAWVNALYKMGLKYTSPREFRIDFQSTHSFIWNQSRPHRLG